MILIAESGSTKTQWCMVSEQEIVSLVNTPGINPVLLSTNEIINLIHPIVSETDKIVFDDVYYYGAGCSSPVNAGKIRSALEAVLACDRIHIDTDLKAACLGLAGHEPGMIALLGTGSNSCIWDGKQIQAKIPSLGYILGDEGGGVSIGKQLLADYLRLLMPEELRSSFTQKYDIDTPYVLERVYQGQMPNRFLAGFAPFAEEHIDHPYCLSLVHEQFKAFFNSNLLRYPRHRDYPVSFCGSIAMCHADLLEALCKEHQLSINKMVKAPIDDLALYHQHLL